MGTRLGWLRTAALTSLAAAHCLLAQVPGYTITSMTGAIANFAPAGVAYDSSGNVYIAGWSGLVRKVSPTGAIVTLAGGGVASAAWSEMEAEPRAPTFHTPVESRWIRQEMSILPIPATIEFARFRHPARLRQSQVPDQPTALWEMADRQPAQRSAFRRVWLSTRAATCTSPILATIAFERYRQMA